MNPFDNQFLAQDRIADLMRVSADIHRGPDRPDRPDRPSLTAALARLRRRLADARAALAAVLHTFRLTERT